MQYYEDIAVILRAVGPIPVVDPSIVSRADVLSYYESVALLLREVGPIPLRDSSIVFQADVREYYSDIAKIVREVGPIAAPDATLVTRTEVLAYYGRVRDERAYGADAALQCKLVLLGDPCAGKTSLLRALRLRRAAPTAPDERTICADVYSWRPYDELSDGVVVGPYVVVGLCCPHYSEGSLGDDRYEVTCGGVKTTVTRDELVAHMPVSTDPLSPLVLHSFDMGGQEAFRATQQVHLEGDALYLLVVSGELRGHVVESVRGWLNTLCARSPGARVVVAVTHADRLSAEEKVSVRRSVADDVGWASYGLALFPSSADSVHVVSSKEAGLEGVGGLREAVVRTVLDARLFPHVREIVPRYYARLAATARMMRRAGGTVLEARALLDAVASRLIGLGSAARCLGIETACNSRDCHEAPRSKAFGALWHMHGHCVLCGACTGSSCLVSVSDDAAGASSAEDVALAPTDDRSRWMPDNASEACLICREEFSFVRRKHHCCQCGILVCDDHSKRTVSIGGARRRVCDPCAAAFRTIPAGYRPVSRGRCRACKTNPPAQRGLEYLHDVGAILYFTRVDRLRSFVALSPQVLIDATRMLIGDERIPGWVAQSTVASGTSSYLADGVLERAALVAAWRPTLHSDDRVAFVYRVMQEFGLFLPLSGDGCGLRISDLPERTLVPSMLRNEEPKGGEAWSRAAVHARRFGARERSFTFKLKKASGGGGGEGGVATAQAPVTLHGLLHGFVVRVAGWCDASGASDWSASPAESAFWALGWRGVHRLSGVRARVALDDEKRVLTLRVIEQEGDGAAAAGAMATLVDRLLALVARDWLGVEAVGTWACMCVPTCECAVAPAAVAEARWMRVDAYRCLGSCGAPVPLSWLDDMRRIGHDARDVVEALPETSKGFKTIMCGALSLSLWRCPHSRALRANPRSAIKDVNGAVRTIGHGLLDVAVDAGVARAVLSAGLGGGGPSGYAACAAVVF